MISIGIVAEDGRELYLQSTDFDQTKAMPWVIEHVFSHLLVCPHLSGNVRGLYAHKEGQCLFRPPIQEVIHGVTIVESNLLCGYKDCPWRTREQIKCELLNFMDNLKYGFPELWGWCSSYDFVALCQVFGTMMHVPTHYPHYMRDIQQVLDERGITDDLLPQPEGEAHNALVDARQIKKIWEMLSR